MEKVATTEPKVPVTSQCAGLSVINFIGLFSAVNEVSSKGDKQDFFRIPKTWTACN
jgi:hypothetical protein